jgi:hypothetical protein
MSTGGTRCESEAVPATVSREQRPIPLAFAGKVVSAMICKPGYSSDNAQTHRAGLLGKMSLRFLAGVLLLSAFHHQQQQGLPMKRSQASTKKIAIVLNSPSNIATHDRYDELLYETQTRFLDCDVFLARNTAASLDDAQDLNINTLTEQLVNLDREGYKQVIIVPVYLLPTEEYSQTKAIVARFNQTDHVDLSKPLTNDRFCIVSFSDIKEMFWQRIRSNLVSLEAAEKS